MENKDMCAEIKIGVDKEGKYYVYSNFANVYTKFKTYTAALQAVITVVSAYREEMLKWKELLFNI